MENEGQGTGGGRSWPEFAPIPLRVHAAIDAAVLGFVLVSPWLLGFSHHRGATIMAVLCFVFGMGLNVATDYPLGLVRMLPMKFHRFMELTTPPITLVAPWMFFAEAGAFPWVMTLAGIAVLANAALTRPVAPA
ncbi:MAG: hypothetical protein ACKOUS_21565 [Alphaproteobacteria bacterium]